jgi:hypothetical protein
MNPATGYQSMLIHSAIRRRHRRIQFAYGELIRLVRVGCPTAAGAQPNGATDAVDDESFADERPDLQVTQTDDDPHHPRES